MLKHEWFSGNTLVITDVASTVIKVNLIFINSVITKHKQDAELTDLYGYFLPHCFQFNIHSYHPFWCYMAHTVEKSLYKLRNKTHIAQFLALLYSSKGCVLDLASGFSSKGCVLDLASGFHMNSSNGTMVVAALWEGRKVIYCN
jgi:hypothetical protein